MKNIHGKLTTFKLTLLISFMAVTNLCANAQTQPIGQMPTIQAKTLADRTVTLPQDLPGEKTLAIIAFGKDQQPNIDTWVQGLNLKNSTEAWVELPVINPGITFVRNFIDGGMRMNVRDEVMRNRIITLYTDRVLFLKSMGLPQKTESIFVVIVTRQGKVLASVEGDYSEEKAAVLNVAFK